MTITAGKKSDRGYFDVYLGDSYLGTGDAFGPCTANCTPVAIFSAWVIIYPIQS